MSNIIDDIVEDVEIKPNKSKFYIKWIVRIAVLAVIAAFIIGQFKIMAVNKINDIEKTGIDNKNAINDLKSEFNNRLNNIDNKIENTDKRIDVIYEKLIKN